VIDSEVDLHRLTADEALLKLDQYLHQAFVAGFYEVRVVHGKGTGTLREVVRRELARHPLVQSFRPVGFGEGGAGVTIVELAAK
jgi:DNA mismatch repair protein MutS2